MCTVCTPSVRCSTHVVRPSEGYARWQVRFGDDVRHLREEIAAGEIDFSQLEMAS